MLLHRVPILRITIRIRDPRKMAILKSSDYKHLIADEFEVLIDANPANPALALMAKKDGDSFIMPMSYEAGRDMAKMILKVLRQAAPQLLLQ
jgi:hypothetical protein